MDFFGRNVKGGAVSLLGLSCLPITGAAPSVSDSYDLDEPMKLAIDQCEGKPPEKIPARSFNIKRPSGWSLGDLKDSMIKLGQKGDPCALAPFPVPSRGGGCLCGGFKMELDRKRRHHRAAMRRLTSAQGTVADWPLSNTFNRAEISASQAASAPSSTVSSRLSSSEPASAARASGGNLRASLRISAGFGVMAVYTSHPGKRTSIPIPFYFLFCPADSPCFRAAWQPGQRFVMKHSMAGDPP